jgi:hypothetical protein
MNTGADMRRGTVTVTTHALPEPFVCAAHQISEHRLLSSDSLWHSSVSVSRQGWVSLLQLVQNIACLAVARSAVRSVLGAATALS